MPSVHHERQLDHLEAACLRNGHQTERNIAINLGNNTGYGDLLVSDIVGNLLLIEYEMNSPKRVPRDVMKRRALGEDATLWIVCPTETLAYRCRQRLRSLDVGPNEPIKILPFFAAIQRLERFVSFCSQVVVQKSENENKSPKYL